MQRLLKKCYILRDCDAAGIFAEEHSYVDTYLSCEITEAD